VRREGDTLGVIAGGGGDHAEGALLGGEAGHLVVGAAQFEGEDGLRVLAFEQHGVADAAG
jgi:hypothetical protein